MSTTSPKSSKPDDTIGYATSLLKEQTIFPRTADESNRIVEIAYGSHGSAQFLFWKDGRDYAHEEPPLRIDLDDIDAAIPDISAEGTIGAAVWLFGPERTGNTSKIMTKLAKVLSEESRLILASENPWPGKLLSKDEFEEFTNEEMSAMLIRVGFGSITEVVDGPFFRLWESTFNGPLADLKLFEAEIALKKEDAQLAGSILEEVQDALGTMEAVREYALLVAECHTLAGRTTQAASALSEALQLDPKCARALSGLGRIAIATGDIDGASDFFESALFHEPALVAALCGRAAVGEVRGDIALAYRTMKEASDLRPFDEELMIEAVRLGNAAGNEDETTRFFLHKSGVTVEHEPQI